MTEPVEIKVTVSGAVKQALETLDLDEGATRKIADSELQQARFEAAIRARGLTFQAEQETKTHQVLTELARMA